MKKIRSAPCLHFRKCLVDNSKKVGIMQQQKFETICNDFSKLLVKHKKSSYSTITRGQQKNNRFLMVVT